uniref:Uncharacterized protein n=1 Tax=Lotus japonicus TaxID=34305 RepID=I3T4D4_LOTJA|nr:unknown [Lotus japonicus]
MIVLLTLVLGRFRCITLLRISSEGLVGSILDLGYYRILNFVVG